MPNLFIIGNGFDLAHGLDTSYQNFRDYLISTYRNIRADEAVLPTAISMPDGGVEYEEGEVLSLLFYLIEVTESSAGEWKDIENTLGHLEFNYLFNDLEDIYDKEGDVNYWHNAHRNRDIASELIIPMTAIQDYFAEWIDSINTYNAVVKADFKKLISDQDQFLTFNYTDTLQEIYDVEDFNVCHIHGSQEEHKFFGHGNNADYTDIYMKENIGSEDHLNEIREHLRKKTDNALQNSHDFFNNLSQTDIYHIYSFGFSFNHVDLIYIEELCRIVDTKHTLWHFHDYLLDSKEQNRREKILKACGFEGRFTVFSCEA